MTERRWRNVRTHSKARGKAKNAPVVSGCQVPTVIVVDYL